MLKKYQYQRQQYDYLNIPQLFSNSLTVLTQKFHRTSTEVNRTHTEFHRTSTEVNRTHTEFHRTSTEVLPYLHRTVILYISGCCRLIHKNLWGMYVFY